MPLNNAGPEWDVVFAYSEWLDQQRLMKVPRSDMRTHENLVDEFFSERASAGREPKITED